MSMIPLPLRGEPVDLPNRSHGFDPALSLRRLTKAFQAKLVLDAIDLDIPSGQFLAVIGKSGCGKSTLLRLLAGLDRLDAAPGQRVLAGEPVGQLGVAEKAGERSGRVPLYLELRRNGQPVDPRYWFAARG